MGVWLRVRTLNSLVFNFRTTVRGMRDSLCTAGQIFSARQRIIGSVSANGASCSNVSSAEIDCVGLFGTTSLSSRALPVRGDQNRSVAFWKDGRIVHSRGYLRARSVKPLGQWTWMYLR